MMMNDDADVYNTNSLMFPWTISSNISLGIISSLEVIPGDAYRVERTGKDKAGGYVTKVVYNTEGVSAGNELKDDERDGGDVDKKLDKKQKMKERRKKQKEKQKLKRKLPDNDDNNDHDGSGILSAAGKTKRAKSTSNTREDEIGIDDANVGQSVKDDSIESSDVVEDDNEAISNLRTSWSIHAPGIVLHSTLCAGLVTLGYHRPTPIQSSSLPAAMLGRRDIVGAAPTGSGKTLGYGLPILQYLLEEADTTELAKSTENQEVNDSHRSLQALILVPTRELAMQVTSELTRVSCNKVKIGTIVGGFAEVKQRRTLEKGRPPILVATPGRLWELVSL
jgi:ATP-dependent RNA helicase DDX24/MAK5